MPPNKPPLSTSKGEMEGIFALPTKTSFTIPSFEALPTLPHAADDSNMVEENQRSGEEPENVDMNMQLVEENVSTDHILGSCH